MSVSGWAGEKVARTRGSTRLPSEERNEQIWKGSVETAGVVSVLAEPPR